MGSSSDSRIMQGASEILDQFDIKHEDQIVSAHRTPARLSEYAKHAEKMGFKVIIAGAPLLFQLELTNRQTQQYTQ